MLKAGSKIAGQWIDLRSEDIVKKILHSGNKTRNGVKIKNTFSTGHEKKFIAVVGKKKYVVRVSLSNDFEWESKAHEVCRREGAHVAPVVECGIQWRGLIPVKYLALEYLPGENLAEDSKVSLSQISRIGNIFGKIHSIDESRFGGGKRKSKLVGAYSTQKRLKEYINYATKKIGLAGKSLKSIREWFKKSTESLDEKEFIRLTHGDPHGNNIVKKDAKVFLIDTDSMALGFAPFEFVQCLLASYNNFDLERQRAFMQGYREEADRSLLQAWEKNKKFISAAVLLKMTWERLKFAESTDSDRRFKRAVSFWKAFLEISSEKKEVCAIGDVNSIVKNKIENNE